MYTLWHNIVNVGQGQGHEIKHFTPQGWDTFRELWEVVESKTWCQNVHKIPPESGKESFGDIGIGYWNIDFQILVKKQK